MQTPHQSSQRTIYVKLCSFIKKTLKEGVDARVLRGSRKKQIAMDQQTPDAGNNAKNRLK